MKSAIRVTFFISLLIIAGCAVQVSPSGGDKDIHPPKVLKFTPENFSTRFNEHDIAVLFDEYIQLKDLSTQLIVSPPLKYPVEAKIKNKLLLIHLDDTLKQNTTYTMNFGNAIADNHEGNAIENFQFVFSTGEIIDSLQISGKVEYAFDKKTEKGVYVMLYRNNVDSLPQKSLPDYFTKTNDTGEFRIRNVSSGDYKIFALKDNNSNYLFDNKEEYISFGDVPVHAGDSGIVLRMFRELPRQQLLKSYSEEPGKVVVVYSRPLNKEMLTFLSDTSSLKRYSTHFSSKRDTITIWYRNQLADSLAFTLQHDSMTDTILVRLKKTTDKGRFKYVPALVPQYVTQTENNLDPGKPIQLVFNHPIEEYALNNIHLTEDSVELKKVKITFVDSMKQVIEIDQPDAGWKEKSKYGINIPPQTLTDIFGIRNDTLQLIFTTKSLSDYGTLELKLQLPEKGRHYFVQLVDDKEVVYQQSIIYSDTSIHYKYLNPKIYRLKLIEDLNENGLWDTGNYLDHMQSERVRYYKENIAVRANWDVDIKWKAEE